MEIPTLDEEEMQMIYNWVDEIPLSRPKRNIARDFSDGGKYKVFTHKIIINIDKIQSLPFIKFLQ